MLMKNINFGDRHTKAVVIMIGGFLSLLFPPFLLSLLLFLLLSLITLARLHEMDFIQKLFLVWPAGIAF